MKTDLRGSKGTIYKPKGPVYQHIGDQYINNITKILKAQEIAGLPSIPEPPSDFTGRDAERQELLEKFESGVNIIGLRGIGGVGKTALAFKLAELLMDRFTDGQVMVDMDGTGDNPATPSQAMASVIHAYYSQQEIPDNEADIRTLYLKVLEGKRALILLDNALDDRQVLKLVPPKTCGLIITSRRTIKLPGLFRKDLDVLKPDKALELLMSVWSSTSGSDSEKPSKVDPAWPEIALLCGYLPLALRAAASYLANYENISPARYAEELKDERTRLERIGEEGVEQGVDACFNLSFQRLDQSTKQTFLNLTVFPLDFDSPAEEQICRDVGNRDLSELVRWSFVDYRHLSPDYGRYRLHDLARLFALARISAESLQSVHQDHAAYYQELLSFADSMYQEGGDSIQTGLDLFDLEKTNILTGQSWAEKNLQESPAAASLCSSYPDTGVYVLDLRLHPRDRIRLLETAVAAARMLKDRSAEGIHLSNLGLAYADLSEPRKAIEHHEQALAIAREIGDRRGEGVDLGNLGSAYKNLGEPSKAIEHYEQALAISREIEDRKNEGAWLGNLGLAYADLGEPSKAIEYYEQALDIARDISDRRNEGNWLGNLGNAYRDLGQTRKAVEHYKQALKISRKIGDRRGEGADLGNLGNAYRDLGEISKAIKHYKQAVKISREIGDRRDEGNHLGNLGAAYADLGEPRKAIEHYEQHLAIAREIEDRRGEAIACWNLGLEYEKAGDLQRAAELMQVCVDFEREIGHPDAEKDAQRLDDILDRLKRI